VSDARDDDVLVFKYLPTDDGRGRPVIPVRLSSSSEAVVAATIAPSLPRTVIAPLWALAIGVSPGGTVVAQVQRRLALNADAWGPQEVLMPVLLEELEEDAASHSDSDDVDWRARDVCLLGHDFLCNLTVILDGLNGRVILDRQSPV